MKKILLLISFIFLTVQYVAAQKNELWVRKNDKGLYLDHKVVAGESFYAIGRKYNVEPKSLAAFNKLDMAKGLLVGQDLKVPLTASNFKQEGNSGTPVFYKVGEKDGLMDVSKNNNNVKLANIRAWNELPDDYPAPGKDLIIGFLNSKAMPAITLKPKAKAEEVVAKKTVEPKMEEPVIVEKKQEIKEPKVEKPVEQVTEKKIEPVVVKEEPVVVKTETGVTLSDNGYFKSFFEQQSKQEPATKNAVVTSGIFKTSYGWKDQKYYLLMDEIAPGTVIKITNPSNNKAVYAKVLGQMNGIRQNKGFDIRLSDSAAAALEIKEEDKFVVKVNYVP